MQVWALSVVGWLAVALPFGGGNAVKRSWSFESDSPGAVPLGFTVAVGDWSVVNTAEGKVLAQTASNADPVFNLLLVDELSARDVDTTVKLRAVAGELYDREAGLGEPGTPETTTSPVSITRKTTSECTRSSTASGRRRSRMPTSSITTAGRTSGDQLKGDHIECYLDGRKLLDVHDASFAEAGKLGLWSKADAQSRFDDLTLTAD